MVDALAALFDAIQPSKVDVEQAKKLERVLAVQVVNVGLAQCDIAEDTIARGFAFQSILAQRAADTLGGDNRTERLSWPDAWFESTDTTEVAACQKVWAHALRENVREELKQAQMYRGRLGSWIGSTDYLTVCDLVGFDRDFSEGVADRLKEVAADPKLLAAMVNKLVGQPGRPTGKRA